MSFIASWWGKQDLNLQGHSPLVSKTSVSTIPPFPQKLVRNQRFELWTYRVSDGCSNQTELIPHKIGCPGKIRTSEMHESKSCALPLGYRAIMVEMRGFEPLSKNNTILENLILTLQVLSVSFDPISLLQHYSSREGFNN